jgi:hypothetical protein
VSRGRGGGEGARLTSSKKLLSSGLNDSLRYVQYWYSVCFFFWEGRAEICSHSSGVTARSM